MYYVCVCVHVSCVCCHTVTDMKQIIRPKDVLSNLIPPRIVGQIIDLALLDVL